MGPLLDWKKMAAGRRSRLITIPRKDLVVAGPWVNMSSSNQ